MAATILPLYNSGPPNLQKRLISRIPLMTVLTHHDRCLSLLDSQIIRSFHFSDERPIVTLFLCKMLFQNTWLRYFEYVIEQFMSFYF